MNESLDPSQKAFCNAQQNNIRLLAPAGCGKTLSLLFRCKYLSQRNQKRQRFLLVTFTVAAKQELLSRLNEDSRFAEIRDNVEVTTLNSWGFRRIKNAAFSPKLISGKNDYHFTVKNSLQPIWQKHVRVKKSIEAKQTTRPKKIMDQIDAFKSIGFDHQRHTDCGLFVERLNELRSQGLRPKIEEMLNDLLKLDILISTTDPQREEYVSDRELYDYFFSFWCEATQKLIEMATFTLEDQKYFAYLDVRKKVEEGTYLSGASRYNHVLVDEFQDINPLDLSLIKYIVKQNRSTVTIVGDDDQAIFEWRGATPEYILQPDRFFEMDFSTFTLNTNYRSPQNIVQLSQRLISNNKRRVDKKIQAYQDSKAKIEIIKSSNLNESMNRVYTEVKSVIDQGQSLSRVAIIGRKKSQIIPYQIFFASKEVPFCAAEDLQVFMSSAFDRLIELIMIKATCSNRQTRSQVVDNTLKFCDLVKRYPLSKKDRQGLQSHLQQSRPSSVMNAVDALEKYSGPLKGNQDGKTSRQMAEAIRFFLNANTVSDSLAAMGNHFQGLQTDLGKAEDDIFYVDPPFLYLAEYAGIYKDDYEQFIDDIERAKDQLAYIPPFKEEVEDELWKRPLHLMTALRAKGKEFDSVILLDVNDGIWPNSNAQTPEQKEAERRVFYVAFTRAKKHVLMFVNKRFGKNVANPSPFISELGL
jgi:DNA helicase-2/ATP-dependent DNA helicase PcrA